MAEKVMETSVVNLRRVPQELHMALKIKAVREHETIEDLILNILKNALAKELKDVKTG